MKNLTDREILREIGAIHSYIKSLTMKLGLIGIKEKEILRLIKSEHEVLCKLNDEISIRGFYKALRSGAIHEDSKL